MAEDCITVTFEDGNTWDYCWDDGMAEPNWLAEDVISGLRKSRSPKARSWRICQYYIKGMSAICSHWQEDTSSLYGVKCNAGTGSETPTGYNGGFCDYLGRRHWCSHYSPTGADTLDEYICVAPNMFLTGLKTAGNIAIPTFNIGGYNNTEGNITSPGRCDCYGMGRGKPGCDKVGSLEVPDDGSDGGSDKIEKELSKLPVMCEYYRPYQMSFGGIEYGSNREELDRRLPLNYTMYNYMAAFQKCQWWDSDYGAWFDMDTGTVVLEDDECFDESGRVTFCTCEDALATPYNTRTLEDDIAAEEDVGESPYMSHGGFMLGNVWAKAGGNVCNGARDDCPCYTGKWNYLTQEKMLPGMPVTANQVFELRFWSYDWHSQEEYDAYFKQWPNLTDPPTASIYTFKKWESLGAKQSDSIMIGKELSMCQPKILGNNEFLPDIYLTVDDPIRYKPMGVTVGTHSPGMAQVFSSLIREPSYQLSNRHFTVVYPYQSDYAVFNADQVCVDQANDGHTKYHHTMYNDYISVVGCTVRNKKVYAINTSFAQLPGGIFSTGGIEGVILLSEPEKIRIFEELSSTVNDLLLTDPEVISVINSDSEQGYFITPPLKLEYGKNQLFMCVDFNDGTWDFHRVAVNNIWSGGVVQQTSYEHAYPDEGVARNEQPFKISPPPTAVVTAKPLGSSSFVELMSVYSETSLSGRNKYSYSVLEKTGGAGESIHKWCSVGNSSAVFVELEDTNLNYIFNWKIVSAKMVPNESEDSDGNSVTIRKDAKEIEMEVIDLDQNSLIPNACILKPKNLKEDRMTFMKSEWTLNIDYTYEAFDSSGSGGANAVAGAGANGDYKAPPGSINIEGYKAIISDIKTGPIGVIAFFKTASGAAGRLVSVMATRVYVMIADVRCRNVDIYYKYAAEGEEHVLIPKSGFCIEVAGSEVNGETNRYAYHPACGDHELGDKWEGPMWYPFNVCRGFDLYDEFTICNYCTASFVGPDNGAITYTDDFSNLVGIGQVVHRKDFRYCGPAEYYSRGEVRGASACHCGCVFYWSGPITGFEWTGIGKIKTSLPIHTPAWEGAPPPFGNDGCELTEKYLSRDYVTHYDANRVIRSEWMPVVMDNSSFYFSFNAFDGGNEREEQSYCDASTTNPFRYVDQLSLFALDSITETVPNYKQNEDGSPSGDRRSFDELFKIHYEGNCSYPPPVLEPNRVMFYDFKDKDVAWAWQERWADVERIIPVDDDGGGGDDADAEVFTKLNFISKYDKPKYVYSLYKEEHRLICDEDIHTITYKGPKVVDGKLSGYPTIQLGGGEPRAFEIIYDNYDGTQITWTNSAELGGSSDNIYEKTTGGEWLHKEGHDTVFDGGASASKDDERCVVVGIDLSGDEVKKYYNRGIDVRIPKDRLVYLPKTEEPHQLQIITGDYSKQVYHLYVDVDVTPEIDYRSKPSYEVDFQISKIFMWDESVVSITSRSEQEVPKLFAIAGINIKGFWGYDSIQHEEKEFIKPGVKLIGIKSNGKSTELLVNMNKTSPYFTNGFESYDMFIKLLPTPKDMTEDLLEGFNLSLIGSRGSIIAVSSLELTVATGYFPKVSEKINVWERKYIPSTFSIGNEELSLDGPGDHMSYNLDGNLSGVYFPFANILDEVAAQNKMRSAYGNGRKVEDEILDISIGNLHDVESEKQKELYEEAYNLDPYEDTLMFSSVIPPVLSEHVRSKYEVSGKCKFTFGKIEWDKHYLVAQFEQFDFWQPGGHYYTWSSDVTIEKCMFFGMFGMEVHSGFFNHYKHTGEGCPKAADLFNAYYTVRPTAAVAKYNRWIILMGEPPAGGGDLLSQANPYAIGIPPGGAWT